ncbi:MAG: hypothetical protein DME23_14210 [Verrucomicrobia bacterium]|nr:MAG: hypothetical protein DME23_14210 [Verrucomicrobiota bacterium]
MFGHLFSGRYKALPVDSATPGYLKMACDYVHLNPVRARLLRPEAVLRNYLWSSYGEGAHRATSAAGDDYDIGVDCPTIAHGERELKNTLRLTNSRD